MMRSLLAVLALLAAASAFVLPVAPIRAHAMLRTVTANPTEAATDVDYEAELKTMEKDAKARLSKAFDSAKAQSEAQSQQRWDALLSDMKAASKNLGL